MKDQEKVSSKINWNLNLNKRIWNISPLFKYLEELFRYQIAALSNPEIYDRIKYHDEESWMLRLNFKRKAKFYHVLFIFIIIISKITNYVSGKIF